jgi:hypothetical protein
MAQFVLTGLALFLFFGAFGPRAMFVILLAVVIFGYALKPLGLVAAIVLLIVLSAVGGHDFRKKEVIILTIRALWRWYSSRAWPAVQPVAGSSHGFALIHNLSIGLAPR